MQKLFIVCAGLVISLASFFSIPTSKPDAPRLEITGSQREPTVAEYDPDDTDSLVPDGTTDHAKRLLDLAIVAHGESLAEALETRPESPERAAADAALDSAYYHFEMRERCPWAGREYIDHDVAAIAEGKKAIRLAYMWHRATVAASR